MGNNDNARTRELVFADGSSNKFWNIELKGDTHTVNFGRVGTAGQSKTKDFGSSEEAKQSFEKLVAEKLKKGYVDSDASKARTAAPAAASSAKSAKSPKGAGKTTRKHSEPQQEAEAPDRVARSEATAPALAPRAPAASTADLTPKREFNLEPIDWFRATFDLPAPLALPEPVAFDLDACVARLAKLKTGSYGWATRWEDLDWPENMTREEAHFWLEATTFRRDKDVKMKDVAARLAKKKFDGKLGLDQVAKAMLGDERTQSQYSVLAARCLLSSEELYELLVSDKNKGHNGHANLERMLAGAHRFVFPYLSVEERTSWRNKVKQAFVRQHVPTTFYDPYPPEHYLAAALGLHDEMLELVISWEDTRYREGWHDHYHRPQDLVLGLGSAELVVEHWRRLRLPMRSAGHVRGFVACTRARGLDVVADALLLEANREVCAGLVEALARVDAPEAALPMLRLKLDSKAPAGAREWLDTHVGNAISGLVEAAAQRGKLGDALIEQLRGFKRQGYVEGIEQAVQASKSEGAARVRAEVIEHEDKVYPPHDAQSLPPDLRSAFDAAHREKPKKLPAWVRPELLPPLVVGERRLNDDQVAVVVQALVATPIDSRPLLLDELRKLASAKSRDAFAWALFSEWTANGSPSKEKWAMGAVGHLGDDECALRLTSLVRAWPGESQHQRAVFGLECLRAIGSNTALMQLSGIAQKLKFKALKARAQEYVTAIAAERGMTREELEDRVIPDCGIGEDGRRIFSFGARSFEFVLGGDSKPALKDEAGKVRPNLPAPGAKDDAELARAALDEWKLMKKQIKDVATVQAARLEQAMVTGRRWPVADFETLFVRHPLMCHLVQKLIWGGFAASGERRFTFRVTDERDYADAADEACDLRAAAVVGVVHPLDLSDEERARWGEVMGDYEIVAPFPQLGREVYGLEGNEPRQENLDRFKGLQLSAPSLVFTLEKLGWIRGEAMDGGCFDEHSKQFPAAQVTAVINYQGTVGMGYIDPEEVVTLGSTCFCQGMRAPSGYGWDQKHLLKLGAVPAVVLSEVLADLMLLQSKSK